MSGLPTATTAFDLVFGGAKSLRLTDTPSVVKASIMRAVSSLSSTFFKVTGWLHNAAISSARFEMLFEPGSVTVPLHAERGARCSGSGKFNNVIPLFNNALHRFDERLVLFWQTDTYTQMMR